MKSADTANLLRDITFHAQPLALLRPRPPLPKATLPGAVQRDARSSEGSRPASPVRDAGYDEGFAKGCEEGRRVGLERGLAEAEVRSREALESLRVGLEAQASRREKERDASRSELLKDLDDLRGQFEAAAAACLERLERDAVTLAFEAVCRIVGEGSGQAGHVARCVRTSMQALRAAKLLRVRLHPDDLERLSLSAEGKALIRPSDAVEWVADQSITCGGCVFDTDLGSVDARMDVQLAGLRQAWSEAARQLASTPGAPRS
jgi:flagellar assembly protein FliH